MSLSGSSTSLYSVAMVLVDRRRFVFKVVGGLLLACLAYCLIAPNDYEASARIAMRASPAGELNLGEGSDGNSAAFASGQTQLENLANIFRSDRLAWIVIVTQRLDRAPGFAGRLARKFTSFRIDAPEPEENHDPDLISEPSDPAFWQRIRARQAAGASIAMHGYRHRCNRVARGLLPLCDRSEFAGVPKSIQRAWIRRGLEILRNHGLAPRLWVAPRHGFDRATLDALRAEGIGYLSDSFARIPFTRDGLVWIPQQLWRPVEKTTCLWTICVHSNTASDESVKILRTFMRAHAAEFMSFDRVAAEQSPGPLHLKENLYAQCALWRFMFLRRVIRPLFSPVKVALQRSVER
ncbi:MAG: DUF2334 domain-containing protein [Terracidiphilus sp.]